MNTVNRIALRRLIAATGVAIFSLVAVACAADTTVAATNGAVTEVTVSGQWARTSPMDAANGAAYATIACPSDDALVGAAVDATAAQKVELHETVMGGATGDTAMGMGSETTMAGQMTMQPVDRIECLAGTPAELKPGGYHIMLFGLVNPLKIGDTLSITLTFERAGDVVVVFPVLEAAP